jgi:AAA15 family ATPase/GTPase
MLQSLHIKNYKNLKDFSIGNLSRVTLITGNNNTGKSSILEAIALFAHRGDLSLLLQILSEREEYTKNSQNTVDFTERNTKQLSSLFTDRIIGFDIDNAISIGTLEDQSLVREENSDSEIFIRFVRFIDEVVNDQDGSLIRRRKLHATKVLESENLQFQIGLEIIIGSKSQIIALDEEIFLPAKPKAINKTSACQFIRARAITRESNGVLFDNITLTAKEELVLNALKIIEPRVERIAFVGEDNQERIAVIKLQHIAVPFPIGSMGDGINRILAIILALVNCENGFLLIDEFENGLHYSAQEKLWKIIFELAKRLNIQVFATTHSEDCIHGFETALNEQDDNYMGSLFRLDSINGEIKKVEFTAEELRVASELDIETR